MQVDWTGPVALLLVLALLVTMLLMFLRKRNMRSIAHVSIVSLPEVKTLEENVPERIAIGGSPDQPVVTIAVLPSTLEYEMAKPLDIQSGTSISRLSSLCQAVPSLLVAGEASGKRLMEVVINGDLVRAGDGNGLRAFTMTADGIKEHARLFEVSNLQNMITAAAIWQIASVVVAQKHLADISKKLDEIKDGVLGISRFLDNQRKSRIRSTYDYLGQVYQAIQGGDLPGAARNQLEHCERDLLEIQHHLETEYRQKVAQKIEHKDTFGTEELTTDIAEKMSELDLLAEDIALCVKTRIAAWHVFSLFPGDLQLKLARRISIQNSIESFQSLGPYCKKAITHEISAIDSFWNSDDTLNERRKNLSRKCDSTVRTVAQKTQQGWEAMERSEQLMLENDRPTRILLQFDNGALVGARQG